MLVIGILDKDFDTINGIRLIAESMHRKTNATMMRFMRKNGRILLKLKAYLNADENILPKATGIQ